MLKLLPEMQHSYSFPSTVKEFKEVTPRAYTPFCVGILYKDNFMHSVITINFC
jgi:hypothetical protein